MKKLSAILLVLCMVFALCACGSKDDGVPSLSYAEFAAADLDTEVTVKGAVQLASYNAEYGNICLFLQNEDGAYYVYRMAATDEDAKALVPGAMIRVTGYKSEWSGEVEITDAKYEVIKGKYNAKAKDITSLLNSDKLIDDINKFIAVKGAKVVSDPLYNWDGSGERGNDLYIDLEVNGAKYNFTVESDEFGADTDVYKAVEALKTGDVIDLEGYLYWYNGANIHISKVTVK